MCQVAMAKSSADLIRNEGRALLIGVGKDDGELFAAEAGHQVAGAGDYVHCRLCDLLEAAVSAQMTIGVVVELEEIDVDQDHRERGTIAKAPPPFVGEALVKAASVGESGELVNHGQLLHFAVGALQSLLGALALADIAGNEQDPGPAPPAPIGDHAEAGFDPHIAARSAGNSKLQHV